MSDNDCSRIFALLSQYLDRELGPASCEEMEEHLRGCPECIQFVESLKRSVRLCHQFGQDPSRPPLDQEAMQDLREAFEKMLARRQSSRLTRPEL